MTANGKVLVVLPAYNAARTLERTIREIPAGSVDALLLVDDASGDETVAIAERLGIPTRRHPQNRGYGANQKTCYDTALEMGADIVVMLHPDYQYDPGLIPMMVERLRTGDCDAVLGSRMLDGGARVGGMPWWKRLGNKVLTRLQNALLGTSLSEFHTGYRAFTRKALVRSGYERFENGFVFDAQMLTALHYRGLRMVEIACPARYLPEASSVDLLGSIRYGLGCLRVSLRYRLNQLGLAPAGWLGGSDPMPLPQSAPASVLLVLAIWFLWSRFSAGALGHPPIRNADSFSYSAQGLVDVVSFTGRAPRTWPVPAFYSLFSDDGRRVLAQVVVGAWVWLGLAAAASAALRHRVVALVGASVVLALGLTHPSALWDGLIMPESLAISVSVATVAVALHHASRPRWFSGAALGVVAGLLALIRPLAAPAVAALALLELVAFIRGRRKAVIASAVGLPIVLALVWLAFLLPHQDRAYAAFERDVRRYPAARYVSDTWASVFYERLIGDPQARAWLVEHGAPSFEPDMRPPRFVDDKEGWWRFRHAYNFSEEWKAWYDEAGGYALTLRLLAASPSAHLERFSLDLPLILTSRWGEPVFDEYGPAAPVAPMAWPFFRSVRQAPIDLVVLTLLCASLGVIARRRTSVRPLSHRLVRIGAGVVVVSAYYIVASWLLVGVEFIRHAAPGPLGLRVGGVLMVLGGVDAILTARTANEARGAEPLAITPPTASP